MDYFDCEFVSYSLCSIKSVVCKRRKDIISGLESVVDELHKTNVEKDKQIADQQEQLQQLQEENDRLRSLSKDQAGEIQSLKRQGRVGGALNRPTPIAVRVKLEGLAETSVQRETGRIASS